MDETKPEWRKRALEHFDAELARIGRELETERRALEQSAAEGARNQMAETLNGGLRRLRQTAQAEDAALLALELSAPFATRCAVFLFEDGKGIAKGARGLGPLPLEFSLDRGEAFRAAIATSDPVIAMGTESEVSDSITQRLGSGEPQKIFLFPLSVRKEVPAILFAAGTVALPAMELISGMAAMQMESLATPAAVPQRSDLVSIEGSRVPKRRDSWAELPSELQGLHLRAQREARLRVAEIRLEHGEALRQGLERRNIYDALREPIDRARKTFREEYVAKSPSMVDYLYLELVRNLAGGNDPLLGPEFPGPLV